MREIQELVRVMEDKTNGSINSAVSGIGVEFGSITETGLQLDNFKHEITDYKMLDYLTMDKDYFTNTNSAGEDSHSHKVVTPDGLKPLKSGDRVLVAQVGNEFIVIGRVR
ncbi:hypothetical protein [Clostridium kluyveri]|uniref:DUF2577 domain-containing protein n=2 Tax=Clostridium kluyveri TaxID=1534 RepID=A5N2A8_CLOK5|nr:hypothetical protein [Clostridium kluyveri]EDK35254.1 Conserved hypothetical protein [Clostridium kluyveri DSM 555]BAH07928.1 hypothetical protein CKR_2877 [Clostridium kluyveri NBRC 12016]